MDVDEVNEQVNSVDQASDVLMQLRQQGGWGDYDGEEKQDFHQQQVSHLRRCLGLQKSQWTCFAFKYH